MGRKGRASSGDSLQDGGEGAQDYICVDPLLHRVHSKDVGALWIAHSFFCTCRSGMHTDRVGKQSEASLTHM